jgi:hypothetical protein
VGNVLAGLVPDSGEVVASSIEEYWVGDDGVEVINGEHGFPAVACFKNLVVVVTQWTARNFNDCPEKFLAIAPTTIRFQQWQRPERIDRFEH